MKFSGFLSKLKNYTKEVRKDYNDKFHITMSLYMAESKLSIGDILFYNSFVIVSLLSKHCIWHLYLYIYIFCETFL